ncbi:MAG TPA: GNAT family N-acetyltransferase [Pseudoxanthomonas sp.]|nr:GNAT family N-acetyltransferase [Pseudoxanthomonas sp.]
MESIHSAIPVNVVAGQPSWKEQLRDGSRVLIRPIRSEDAPAELAFIEALSPDARHNRFLGQIGHPSDEMVRRFVDLDFVHDVGFVAVDVDGAEVFLGVGRYSIGTDETSCECAISVLDAWQGRGLGTALMTHLIEVARSRGITRMWSVDAAENAKMRDLAHHLGFERKPDPDNSAQVLHTLAL